ncbi:MAG: GIY-YIG nuclease family protein [Cytophagales bacterium]|nr:GIY-YIG nuclease family protein [Cytophagales bacterium]MCA6385676.1 GIY-YIG nuclease family protein [Cytophagales bacterium]
MDTLTQGVYFIYAPNQSKVKIGRSKNINTRFNQLRTGFMDEGILLIGILTKNEVQLESELHEKFLKLRANGEWFYLTNELKNFILTANLIYDNVTLFDGLSRLKQDLTFQNIGLLKYDDFIKKIQRKYILPTILIIAGFSLAYSNYKLGQTTTDSALQFSSYFILAFFPLYTPVLMKLILEYTDVKTHLQYSLILLLGFVFESFNLIFHFDTVAINLFRILVSVSYLSFTRIVLIQIWINKRNELNDEKAKIEIKSLSGLELINRGNLLINRIKMYKRNTEHLIKVMSILTYLTLSSVLIILEEYSWSYKLRILAILNAGVILWLILNFVSKLKSRFKLMTYTISGTMFLTMILSSTTNLFFHIMTIYMGGFIPLLIYGIYTSIKEKEYEPRINEILLELKKIKK